MNTEIDCSRFNGRMRDICEGKTHHSKEQRDGLVRFWIEGEKPRGLGDTVKAWIDRYVPAWLKPKKDCGCKERQELLNRIFPWMRESKSLAMPANRDRESNYE